MEKGKTYYSSINIARGMAILLVVLGHALSDIYLKESSGNPWLPQFFFVLIYSFHMPLFVFLSGFCNAGVLEQDTKGKRRQFLWKRFRRLIIPYLSWGMLYVVLDIVGGNYTWQEFRISRYLIELLKGDNANWQLWTLYTLFVCSLLSVIFYSWLQLSLEKMTMVFGVIAISIAIMNGIPNLPRFLFYTIINTVLLYYFAFSVGILSRRMMLMEHSIWNCKTVVIVGLILILFANAGVGTYLNRQMGLDTDWLKIVGAPVGVFVIVYLAVRIQNGRGRKFWDYLGNHCMSIYIFANICQVIVRKISMRGAFAMWPRIIFLLISIVVSITIPVWIKKILVGRIKIARLVLLGEG